MKRIVWLLIVLLVGFAILFFCIQGKNDSFESHPTQTQAEQSIEKQTNGTVKENSQLNESEIDFFEDTEKNLSDPGDGKIEAKQEESVDEFENNIETPLLPTTNDSAIPDTSEEKNSSNEGSIDFFE